jgi:hypothetical protein
MSTKKDDEPYSDEEATRRMNEALLRALNTPPKAQATVRHPRRKTGKKAGDRRSAPKRGGDGDA